MEKNAQTYIGLAFALVVGLAACTPVAHDGEKQAKSRVEEKSDTHIAEKGHSMDYVNPGPWVNPEITEPEPWKSHDGIVKFFEFPVPIPEMSPRAFHLYWQKHHSPWAMNVTSFSQFMRKYNSSHKYSKDPLKLPAHYKQDTPFEGAAEVWVNSIAEVGDWLGNPIYPELIQPDEPRFIAQDGSAEIIIAKEERLYEPELDMIENLKTKVYLLVTAAEGSDYEQLHASASAHGKLILAQPSLKQHLKKLVVSHKLKEPLPLEGFELHDIDVIYELWFEDIASATAFFDEADYSAKIVENESKVFNGAEIRGLVVKMRVVHDEFSFQPSTTQPMAFSWE